MSSLRGAEKVGGEGWEEDAACEARVEARAKRARAGLGWERRA